MNTFLRYYFGAIAIAVAVGVFLLRVPSEKTRALMLTMPPKITGVLAIFCGVLLIASTRRDALRHLARSRR